MREGEKKKKRKERIRRRQLQLQLFEGWPSEEGRCMTSTLRGARNTVRPQMSERHEAVGVVDVISGVFHGALRCPWSMQTLSAPNITLHREVYGAPCKQRDRKRQIGILRRATCMLDGEICIPCHCYRPGFVVSFLCAGTSRDPCPKTSLRRVWPQALFSLLRLNGWQPRAKKHKKYPECALTAGLDTVDDANIRLAHGSPGKPLTWYSPLWRIISARHV